MVEFLGMGSTFWNSVAALIRALADGDLNERASAKRDCEPSAAYIGDVR